MRKQHIMVIKQPLALRKERSYSAIAILRSAIVVSIDRIILEWIECGGPYTVMELSEITGVDLSCAFAATLQIHAMPFALLTGYHWGSAALLRKS